MAKTRAEIQKAYRERKKATNNAEYLRKEKERRRRNYVPSAELTNRERLRRNEKNNKILISYRQRKRAQNNNQNIENETSGYDSPGAHMDISPARLVVQMPFRANGPRKRISRVLSKKSRELSKIKTDFHQLQKKYKTTLRKLQRMKKKETTKEPNTPRSKTNAQLRDAGISGEQVNKIRRQLLLSHALIEEVKMAKKVNKPGKTSILRNVVAGRIIRKYRCISTLSKKIGLNRNKVGKVTTKCIDYNKQRRSREVKRYRDDVIRFMERDDNSRQLPGKADKVKTGVHESTQTRVLTDYLSNLHAKFVSENPTVKLSLASFQRIRPKYIRTTSFITRDSCLCTKHQNMALILKALRQEGVSTVPNNPETFVEMPSFEAILEALNKPEITFDEWKRVAIEEKGKKKMVMKIVKVVKVKEEFMSHLINQSKEFEAHVSRMKTQYEQIRLLKEKLPLHHVVIHMDFAENYSCRSLEEIQSAYWNQQSVTLHPIVVYTRNRDNEQLQHQSFVVISDDLNHNAATVITFVKDIIKDIKEIDPEVEYLHFWTDSPTSQYRNRTIFNFVANHEETMGVKARWNYFEAGHGKGPCDGLGGCTKRMADQAMKSGKVVIQDATDFFSWTQSSMCTMRNVKFKYIRKEQCEIVGTEIDAISTKTIKGTMKIHAIVGQGSNTIFVRDVSCYCEVCIQGGQCNSWTSEITSTDRNDHANDTVTKNSAEIVTDDTETYDIGDYIIAIYENKWYVGKIVDTDLEDQNGFMYNVSFMEKRKKMFQWPRNKDIIWCKNTDIKFKLSTPIPSGKSERMYKLESAEWVKISNFDNM